jgi:hypothetical protein
MHMKPQELPAVISECDELIARFEAALAPLTADDRASPIKNQKSSIDNRQSDRAAERLRDPVNGRGLGRFGGSQEEESRRCCGIG